MAILSEAVVTEGEALGITVLNSCLEGSTSYQTTHIARYCLSDSSPYTSNPGTLSRVTDASLSTALQADRHMRHTTISTITTITTATTISTETTITTETTISVAEVISVVCVVCHFVTSAVAPVLPVVSVVCVVV